MVKISSSRKLCLIVAAILGVAGIVCLCTSHPLRGIGFLFLAVVFAAPKRKGRSSRPCPYPDYLKRALRMD